MSEFETISGLPGAGKDVSFEPMSIDVYRRHLPDDLAERYFTAARRAFERCGESPDDAVVVAWRRDDLDAKPMQFYAECGDYQWADLCYV